MIKMGEKYILVVEPDERERESIKADLAGHFGASIKATSSINDAVANFINGSGMEAVIGVISEAKFPPNDGVDQTVRFAYDLHIEGLRLIIYTAAEPEELRHLRAAMNRYNTPALSKSEDGIERLRDAIGKNWGLQQRR